MKVVIQSQQIERKSLIPKIISGIIATISIGICGYLMLPSLWFWMFWEVAAAALVAFGCGGEWYLFKNPSKEGGESHHRKRELQAIAAVTIGVWMEFFALGHAIPEALRLENDNLVLRSNVVALEIAASPRRINGNQRAAFSKSISALPWGVAIVSTIMDAESSDLADDLDAAFRDAHWATRRQYNFIGKRYGVVIGTVGPASEVQTQISKRIKAALDAIGIASKCEQIPLDDIQRTTPYFETNVLYLIIGHKSTPILMTRP